MSNRIQKNEYSRPSIKSMKAEDVVASMGPAHAIYGTTSGGSGGQGPGKIE